MGAEYVFIDVLGLKQDAVSDNSMSNGTAKRRMEWIHDIPTIGDVYRCDRYQTTIVYFNGLGMPFEIRGEVLDSPLH